MLVYILCCGIQDLIGLVEAGNEIRQRRLEAGFACDVGRAGGHRGIAQGQAGGSGRSRQ